MAWAPEIAVDRELARRLIGSQFAELDLRSLEQIGEGWDNTVWLVDERWVFRFPRREIAVPGFLRELEVLPRIARRLDIAIPTPVFRGRALDGYPWPFAGSELIAGTELGGPRDESALAGALGAFLRCLHDLEPPVELPIDPNRRADMPHRVTLVRKSLGALARARLWSPDERAEGLLDAALELDSPDRAVTSHGDLHFRHVLVDPVGALTGVIDWGDVCLAAPSVDLQLYWSALGPEGREAFTQTYGPIAEDDLLRARVLALGLNAILAEYGHDERREGVKDEALASLARTVAD